MLFRSSGNSSVGWRGVGGGGSELVVAHRLINIHLWGLDLRKSSSSLLLLLLLLLLLMLLFLYRLGWENIDTRLIGAGGGGGSSRFLVLGSIHEWIDLDWNFFEFDGGFRRLRLRALHIV